MPLRTRLLLPIAALSLLLCAGAAPAVAKNCPRRHGTISRTSIGIVWHTRSKLYGCTVVDGIAPKKRALGPWAKGSKVAWDGATAVWSVPVSGSHPRDDRMWATSADTGAQWLKGVPPVPGGTGPARALKIVLADQAAAWVTDGGDVVMALRAPDLQAPRGWGDLPGPLAPSGNLLLVGRWADAAAHLSQTVFLKEFEGEGDGCGGVNPYLLVAQPYNADPFGVAWDGDWVAPNC